VDWGDGSPKQQVTAWNDPNATHIFSTPGDYTIKMDGVATRIDATLNGNEDKLIEILNFGEIGMNNCNQSFENCDNLTISATAVPGDFSTVTDMQEMFYRCSNLNYIPLLDTSNVTNMRSAFRNCDLLEVPLLDTSKVTNMERMFDNNQNLVEIPHINTSGVTNFTNMFNYCRDLETVPELDLSSARYCSDMFNYCTSMTGVPALDTSGVLQMREMFIGCSELVSVPTLDTSSATHLDGLFRSCSKIQYVPTIDIGSVSYSLQNMFSRCYDLKEVTFTGTSNPNIQRTDRMFELCYDIESVPHFDTSNVTNMNAMFGLLVPVKVTSLRS
jgi:surface protein